MAKKNRSRKTQTPRLSAAQMVKPQAEETPSETAPVPQATKKMDKGLREEYHYVVADLKRIALIAAIMLAVMIVLAVFLI